MSVFLGDFVIYNWALHRLVAYEPTCISFNSSDGYVCEPMCVVMPVDGGPQSIVSHHLLKPANEKLVSSMDLSQLFKEGL